MAKERIHLYLPSDLIQALQTLAPQNGGTSALAEELLRAGLSLKKGEIIEQQSLPVIRDIMENTLSKALAQLHLDLKNQIRTELRQEEASIIAEMKARERRSDDRLAGLIIRAIREGGISRRMLFTYLAKEDSQFAMEVYEDALAKVGKDIATRLNELPS